MWRGILLYASTSICAPITNTITIGAQTIFGVKPDVRHSAGCYA
jgi:hypothetical protein